jgi:hypothetical protein
MFYNRSFTEAYTKQSRTNMTMRISRFVSQSVLKYSISYDDMVNDLPIELYSIKSITDKINMDFNFFKDKIENYDVATIHEKYRNFFKIICKGDPTVEAIYSMFDSTRLTNIDKRKHSPVCIFLPTRVTTMYLKNDPGVILQYIYNKQDFIDDERNIVSDTSIEKDCEIVISRLGKQILDYKDPLSILSVYNDMAILRAKKVVMIAFNRSTKILEDSITDVLENNNVPHYAKKIVFSGTIISKDPYTQNIIYLKENKFTTDYNKQFLETMCLYYSFLAIKCNKQIDDIRLKMEKLKFLGFDKIYGYKDILNIYNWNYVSEFEMSLNEKKMAAFLTHSLMDNNDLNVDLSNSAYLFTYDYRKKADYYPSGYKGLSICDCSYMGKGFKCIQNNMSKPIVITDSLPNRTMIPAYNAALKLGNHISNREFEINLYKDYLIKSKIKLTKILVDELKVKYGCYAVVDCSGDKYFYIDFDDIDYESDYYPIFITRRYINKFLGNRFKHRIFYPRINKLSVYASKYKIYTLPFWNCNQYENVICDDDEYLNGISTRELFKSKLLYNYLMNKHKLLNYKRMDVLLDDSCVEDLIDKMKINLKNDFKNKNVYSELFKNKDNLSSMYATLFDKDIISDSKSDNKLAIIDVDIDFDLIDIGIEDDCISTNVEKPEECDDDFGLIEDFVLENVDLSYTPSGSELTKETLLNMLVIPKDIAVDMSDEELIDSEHMIGILEEEILMEQNYYLSQNQLKILGGRFEVNPEDIILYKEKTRKKLKTGYIFDFFNRLPSVLFYVIYNTLFTRRKHTYTMTDYILNTHKIIAELNNSYTNNNSKKYILLISLYRAFCMVDVLNDKVNRKYHIEAVDNIYCFTSRIIKYKEESLKLLKNKKLKYFIENKQIYIYDKISLHDYIDQYMNEIGLSYDRFGIQHSLIDCDINHIEQNIGSDDDFDLDQILRINQ